MAGSAATLLAGCGGGGGTTQQLAGDSGSGSLELTPTGETYFKADCSGPVIATDSMSAKVSGKPDGTADMLIKLAENAAATSLRVDKITSSLPAYAFQRTGTTVKYLRRDNQPQWCVDVDNGESCLWDEGTQPALSVPGGLSLRGSDLYTVILDKGAYVLDMHYVKKYAHEPDRMDSGPAIRAGRLIT
ncbi:hypothetical protein CLU91_1846 [Janthinobacterium sp. 64]|nr:hypothetical protein CLU91_1846 [Janthinobacterium sp. 64]